MSFRLLLPPLALSLFLGMPTSDATASEVDAAGYYKLRCATCHGVSGEGTRDKSPSLGPCAVTRSASYFRRGLPARSVLGVSGLPNGSLVEIAVIAGK